VLVHTPYRTHAFDWEREGESYTQFLLEQLEQRGMPGLRASAVVQRCLTPVDIERLYGSHRGAIYGSVTRRGLTSAFKPGNRSELFPGLYFCGGSSNPGAGVPMVLMSGQIAAACVLTDCGLATCRPSSLGSPQRAVPRGQPEEVEEPAGAGATGAA
jgi:diapolycopene oxygenase